MNGPLRTVCVVLAGCLLSSPAAGGATALTYVAQAAINRPVGYQNMFNSDGIAFVPGSRYGAGQADRLILVNNDNFSNQRFISAWRIDGVAPGTLTVSEAQTVLANNGIVNFSGHFEASFVDDAAHPHLLLAVAVWNFYSQVAVVDLSLDMNTYAVINLTRPGGGDNARSVAWDPLRDDAAGHALIYDGSQGGAKLSLLRKLTAGYPPTASTTTTGYTDPPEINTVVSARTWSATTQTFFTALENGTTIFETDGTGALLGTTDVVAYLPAEHVIVGLANDDSRGYLWLFSKKHGTSGSITAFSLGAATTPRIGLDPATLAFDADQGGPNPASQHVTVSNLGAGDLNWTAAEQPDVAWLSVSPTSGTGGQGFDAQVDVAGLAPGVYNAQIAVADPNAANSPQVVSVTLNVFSTVPAIALNPTSLNFVANQNGSNPAGRSVQVNNTNPRGTLNWNAAESAEWMSLTDPSGSDGDSFQVSIDITGLDPGTYQADVTIADPNASNSPQTVAVTLLVRPESTGIGADIRTERWGASTTALHPGSPMDATVNAASPSSNAGTSTDADVDASKLTLLHFDLSDLQATDQVYKATVRLWTRKRYACCTSYHNGSVFAAYGIRDMGKALWNESQVTFAQRAAGVPWSDTGTGDLLTALDPQPAGTEWYFTWSTASTDYPHWQSVDVTSLVQDWVAGVRPNHGLALRLVQSEGATPAFYTKDYSDADCRPYLEITYYRPAQGNPNRPLQPTGVAAFHRQGQTFLTFQELTTSAPLDLLHFHSVRYRVYRHTAPITSANIDQAALVADLSRDSGKVQFALNNFTKYVNAFGEYHVIDDYAQPLAAGTGLFVYTVKPGADEGTHYYAVTAAVDGNENVADFDLYNTTDAIAESYSTVKRPVAVADSPDGSQTQYMMWLDSDWGGLYGEAGSLSTAEPIYGESYALDFRVGKPAGAGPFPLVFRLNAYGAHGILLSDTGPDNYGGSDGWIGLSNCYHVTTDDNFKHWHFGHLREYWTGRPPLAEYGAVVLNYREALHEEILKWITSPGNFKGYNVDAKRMYVTGGSMGGTGTFCNAVHHPERWAGMMSNEGITNWATDGTAGGSDFAGGSVGFWGKQAWNLPVYDLIDGEFKGGVWDHQNYGLHMVQNRGGPVTLMTSAHGTLDNTIEWQTQGYPWYLDNAPYEQAAWPMFGRWMVSGHTPDVKPDKSPMFFGRVDEPLLCFAHSDNNDVPVFEYGNDSPGMINKELEWSNSANNWDGLMQETPTSFRCSVRLDPAGAIAADTVDVTPRRVQEFLKSPGQPCFYRLTDIASGAVLRSGTVIADADALLTIADVPFSKTGTRIFISAFMAGDINHDAAVDISDLLALATAWDTSEGEPGYNPACDLSGDHTVDVADLLVLAGAWGQLL